ncbi:MAG: hypothetical protein WKI04_13505 [Ferruginibacter sp.]
MDLQKDDIIYTAEDIERYFSGKLEPPAMHAIERAALDDPFLAEAMEGYGGMQETKWKEQVGVLRDNFAKGPTATIVPLNPQKRFNLRIAAAIVIICSTLAVTYLVTTKTISPENSIAALKTTDDSLNSIPSETGDTDSTVKTSVAPTAKEKAGKIPVIKGETVGSTAESGVVNPPSAVPKKEEKQFPGEGVADDQTKNNKDLAINSAASKNKETAGSRERVAGREQEPVETVLKNQQATEQAVTLAADVQKPAPLLHKFYGQVVDREGNPLPFANVGLTGQNIGTYTDARGTSGWYPQTRY